MLRVRLILKQRTYSTSKIGPHGKKVYVGGKEVVENKNGTLVPIEDLVEEDK